MKFILSLLLFAPTLLNAQIITTIVGKDTAGYSGDGGVAINAALHSPYNVKFDHEGNMYIADEFNNVIRKINTDGIIGTVAGNGYGAGNPATGGYTGDNGPATVAELWGPSDVAFDAAGNLYIADNGNAVIRKVNASGIITLVAGTASITGIFNGDNIPATAANLNDPCGLVFDNAGNLYFSDAGHYRVRKINTSGIISTIAGTGINGYSGDNGPATAAQLSIPQFLAISPSGNLYIPDWVNHRVRKVNSSGIISTVAGNGIATNNNDGFPATDASVQAPEIIVFDDSGNYYISSVTAGTIRRVNTTGIITTVVGNDTCGYRGDGGPAIDAEINGEANCSAIDAGGNLYIADSKNNRIRVVIYNTTTVHEVNKTEQNVTLYPNPAHDKVTVSTGDEIESVVVVSAVGQSVASPRPSPGEREISLNIEYLPKGIYFVKVNGVYAGRFVKE